MKINNAARTAAALAVLNLIDVGGAGTLRIFSGTQPTLVADADSGLLLASGTLSNPAFATPVNGVATANAITPDASNDNTGTAGYWRIRSGGGLTIMQGSVGTTSGFDLVLSTLNFVQGGTFSVSSLTYTVPVGT